MHSTDNNNFLIVGIGASAGGLEAFLKLIAKVPINSGMAFIFIQHLEPSHPSLAVEIISRVTDLAIEEATNGTSVKPNHIYLLPPKYNMEISDGVLKLSARKEVPGLNIAIDIFFQSLAFYAKHRAIGIVLSGTGSDGTKGIEAIKAEGGTIFVQDPKSAKYTAMPEHAIATGVVDLVLPPERIAKELIRLATHPYITLSTKNFSVDKSIATPLEEIEVDKVTDNTNANSNTDTNTNTNRDPDLAHHSLQKIFKLLRIYSKVDFTSYKQTTIKRRIHRRMMVHKIKSLQAFVKYLQTHDEEVSALYNDILINVTEFFRDPTCFDDLAKMVFPSFISNGQESTSIRIWVPGCSTGEEAYSLAIAIVEFLENAGKKNPVQIFATDISESALRKARIGYYSDVHVQNISKERLGRFFEKVDGGYKITKAIRDICLFSRHDVTSDPPFAKLSFISCRNVLIYFTKLLQERVILTFHYALNPGGYLWLGKSENLGELSRFFNLLDNAQKIYSKSNITAPPNFHFSVKHFYEAPDVKTSKISGQTIAKAKPRVEVESTADKIILAKFSPPGVIVNNALEIIQFRGRTVPFLEPTTGKPSLNLLKMIRPELLVSLRTAIETVKKENKSTLRPGLHFEVDGKHKTVEIEVLPINVLAAASEQTFLVLFKDTTNVEKSQDGKTMQLSSSALDDRDKQISELVNELSEIRSYQQSIVERYEATQEELTTTNEELQSANEELQSSNEEIQTAQEELQSTNEELVTVNDELQIRNHDLTTLSSDLNNLLASIEVPILIVGADHRIRRFSLKAKNAFNLIPADIGRKISDFKPNFNLNLDGLISEVADNLISKKIEIQDHKGTWLQVQIRPYRTVDNKIDGAIIELIDIDALKKKEIQTKESLDYNTSVAEAVQIPLAVMNQEGVLQSANGSFYKYFQTGREIVGKDLFGVLNLSVETTQKFHNIFSQAIRKNAQFADIEINYTVSPINLRKISISGGKINWIGLGHIQEQEALLVSFVDVTEQRQLEEERKLLLLREQEACAQAEKANLAKDIFLATLSHELRTPLSAILTWAQLISEGKVDFEKAKQGAAVIEQSAKAQSQLIDDLLDVSRIIAGKFALELRAVDPAVVIRAAIESVNFLATKKSIQIKFEPVYFNDLSVKAGLINADTLRLQQIIWNLLTNAIKFSPVKSIIRVELNYIKETTQSFAQITVSDQGKGIPPDFLPHIFKQFSQADMATTRVHGGLGLGLSIVHNLVELQNGTITANNIVGGTGAIFTVRFPLIAVANSIDAQSQVEPEFEAKPEAKLEPENNKTLVLNATNTNQRQQLSLNGLRILIVDDDNSAIEAIAIYLKSFGAEVMTVESAKLAFAALPIFMPHVLLSDIAMPGEDGYSLIRRIRELKPEQGGSVPALALTAFVTAEDSERALNAGFQAHIAKPVEAYELARAILKISRQKI